MEEGETAFGLELECGVKETALPSSAVGEYHRGRRFGAGDWLAMTDSSIDFEDEYTEVELVSPIFTLSTLEKTLNQVRDRFASTDEVLSPIKINDSCGAHIHFSWKPKRARRYNMLKVQIPLRTIKWIRETVMERVHTECPNLYGRFHSHYFRDAAQESDDITKMYHDKYSEFHFTDTLGVEWRSFNLLGCRTWADVKKMVRIGCETIDKALNEEIYESNSFEIPDAVFDDRGIIEQEKKMFEEFMRG